MKFILIKKGDDTAERYDESSQLLIRLWGLYLPDYRIFVFDRPENKDNLMFVFSDMDGYLFLNVYESGDVPIYSGIQKADVDIIIEKLEELSK